LRLMNQTRHPNKTWLKALSRSVAQSIRRNALRLLRPTMPTRITLITAPVADRSFAS